MRQNKCDECNKIKSFEYCNIELCSCEKKPTINMEKRIFKHKPTGFIYEKRSESYYLNQESKNIIFSAPTSIVESGSDWEEVKEIKYSIGSAGNLPSIQKVLFMVGKDFEEYQLDAIIKAFKATPNDLLNGESTGKEFSREDISAHIKYWRENHSSQTIGNFEDYIKNLPDINR